MVKQNTLPIQQGTLIALQKDKIIIKILHKCRFSFLKIVLLLFYQTHMRDTYNHNKCLIK